jgi:D-tyrosyl-tRNA(Tyr) deacylase
MIGLLQRVTNARVEVDGHTVGEIGRGLLVLVAVHRDDGERDVARLAERILSYRVFPDDDGRMNRSVVDEGGGLLLVPQFLAPALRGLQRPKKARPFFGSWSASVATRFLRWRPGSSAQICRLPWSTTARLRSGSRVERSQYVIFVRFYCDFIGIMNIMRARL